MAIRLIFLAFMAFLSGSAVQHDLATSPALIAQSDKAVLEVEPELVRRMALRIGRPDAEGLIGRNRQWGLLSSVRFQYGAGRALRYGTSVGDETIVAEASRAIMAGMATMDSDGGFPIVAPPQFAGRAPSLADRASAAAFFLSDACTALLVADEDHAVSPDIAQALAWLSKHAERLAQRDRLAPNRLLITALAFESCSAVTGAKAYSGQADDFVSFALQFARADGVMAEKGGSDTSYQAVSLVASMDLLNAGYDGEGAVELREFAKRGGAWLASQVRADGSLDSSANTRTCTGEAFLGKPKQVDLWEVFRALAYHRVMFDQSDAVITRYSTWLRSRPDPCAEI